MKLFLLVVVCLAAIAVETHKPKPVATTTKKPTTTADTTTTKSTARTTTTTKPVTSTTTGRTTTAKPTTTTTSKTTITLKTTVKPSSSTTVRTTSTKPATSATTTTTAKSTAKPTTSVKTTTRTTTSKTTTVKTTSSLGTTTTKASTVLTTKPTTATTPKKTTAGTTPAIPSTSSTKSSTSLTTWTTSTTSAEQTTTSTAPTTSTAEADTTTSTVPSRTSFPSSFVTSTTPNTAASTTQVETTTASTPSEVASSSTLWTTTTTTTPSPVPFNCTVSSPACGTMCTNLTSAGTGVVQSRNFPGDYGTEERVCEVYITTPAEWMIQLKFTTFNLETRKAFVTVFGYQHVLLPSTYQNKTSVILATIGAMKIIFSSYPSGKPASAVFNWQATFSVTSQGSSCSVTEPACGTMCTNVTSAGTGIVQSRNFPGDYGKDGRTCLITMIVPAGKRIRLEFTTFNLETGKSSIKFRDRNTTYLSGVTGNTIPAVVTTTSNLVFMEFTSFSSTKPNTTTYNWQATYTAV